MTNKMTIEEIQSELKICDAATKEPWEHDGYASVISVPMMKLENEFETNVPDDATEDDWEGCPEGRVCSVPCDHGDTAAYNSTPDAVNNIAFICHARDGYPQALREIIELKNDLAKAVKLLNESLPYSWSKNAEESVAKEANEWMDDVLLFLKSVNAFGKAYEQ